jgi:hypothetical protein
MQKILFALAALTVVIIMCVATAMSPTAGSALARADGHPMPINELMITAKQLPEQSFKAY